MSYRLETWTIAQKWITMNENVKKRRKKAKKRRKKMKKTKKMKAKNKRKKQQSLNTLFKNQIYKLCIV